MHALVVGGTGGMGQGVARDLIKQEQIEKVILGDINTDPAGCRRSCGQVKRYRSSGST